MVSIVIIACTVQVLFEQYLEISVTLTLAIMVQFQYNLYF